MRVEKGVSGRRIRRRGSTNVRLENKIKTVYEWHVHERRQNREGLGE